MDWKVSWSELWQAEPHWIKFFIQSVYSFLTRPWEVVVIQDLPRFYLHTGEFFFILSHKFNHLLTLVYFTDPRSICACWGGCYDNADPF